MTYSVEWDENGDEVVYLVEQSPFPLPVSYAGAEVMLAATNLLRGFDRRDLAVSRVTLHEAVQIARATCSPPWGQEFIKDPRRFSSTPIQGR